MARVNHFLDLPVPDGTLTRRMALLMHDPKAAKDETMMSFPAGLTGSESDHPSL
jgi:hypothetical protein